MSDRRLSGALIDLTAEGGKTGNPCDFCRRDIPCECAGAECMCSCGRCMAEPLPIYVGPVHPDWLRGRLA